MPALRHLAPVVWLLACTSTEPPPAPVAKPSPAPVVEPEPEPTPPQRFEQTAAWQWTSALAPGTPEVDPSLPNHITNGPVRIEARTRDTGGVEVEQSRDSRSEWITVLGAERGSRAAALQFMGDIVVAHYPPISTGATLARLDRTTGAVVWEVPLEGLGPLSHGQYLSEVQLTGGAGRIRVHGRESAGAYVEVRALEDGALIEHSRVEPALVDRVWTDFESPSAGREGLSLPEGWSLSDTKPRRLHYAPPGGPTIDLPLPNDEGDCEVGHAVQRDDMLYLAHGCSITAGARLHALSLTEGSWQWNTQLQGLGPIAHSAYSNRVRLEWTDGRLFVYGDEAMGRYLEAVEPETGRTLVTKRWPAAQ